MSKYTQVHIDYIKENYIQWNSKSAFARELMEVFPDDFLTEWAARRVVQRHVWVQLKDTEQRDWIIKWWNWWDHKYKNRTHMARALQMHFGLEEDEKTTLERIRKVVWTEKDPIEPNPAYEMADRLWIDRKNVKAAWITEKSEDSSVAVRLKFDSEEKNWNEIVAETIETMKDYSPVYPNVSRSLVKDPHLLIIDPADVHIGKLSTSFQTWEEYNNQIAVQRVNEWVQWILDKSSGWNLDEIYLIWGNDILHIDSPKRQTTAWTHQDTDGMWYDNAMIARDLYIDIIEKLMVIAPVKFIYCPSNHDFVHWFFLAQIMSTWFRKAEGVRFDCSLQYMKHSQYHKNMLSFEHWDWVKQQNIAAHMATDDPQMWNDTTHRYCYLHHLHHKISKDQVWVTVEHLRSPSWTDARHDRKWYKGVPKALEWFVHHPEYWQVARLQHNF